MVSHEVVMTTCTFQRLSGELNLQCSFFRSSSVKPTNKLWPRQEPVIPQLMYPKHHFCIFFMTKHFFYFSLWPFSSYWLNTLLTQRASMVTNRKACCQNMTNHRKVNKTIQRPNIVLKDMNGKVVNRATIQPFKDRELKTQRNDNCYIFQHRQQSDYRATLIFALYQVD